MPRRACSDLDIQTKQTFCTEIRALEKQGYRLVFIEENGKVVAVAGDHIYTNLYSGKHLYVDDLVTSARARARNDELAGRAGQDCWL